MCLQFYKFLLLGYVFYLSYNDFISIYCLFLFRFVFRFLLVLISPGKFTFPYPQKSFTLKGDHVGSAVSEKVAIKRLFLEDRRYLKHTQTNTHKHSVTYQLTSNFVCFKKIVAPAKIVQIFEVTRETGVKHAPSFNINMYQGGRGHWGCLLH